MDRNQNVSPWMDLYAMEPVRLIILHDEATSHLERHVASGWQANDPNRLTTEERAYWRAVDDSTASAMWNRMAGRTEPPR